MENCYETRRQHVYDDSEVMMAHHKSMLPEKICPVCGRPFAWRKKWAKVWEEVKFCSERCRRRKLSSGTAVTEDKDNDIEEN
ncbi:DUF2256 domain-containing protein [Mariniblastus sp.]|nr:DUF2256 domain-containing protein [Mariniblastus sp.]